MRLSLILLAVLSFQCLPFSASAQGSLTELNLKNVLVVGQLDRQEDRYTVEINLGEIFANNGIKTMASLNVLKQGTLPEVLASDSIQAQLKAKGIDTYVLVSVRGYDRKFKAATKHEKLAEELEAGHSFPLYRDEIVSVTLEFRFYRGHEIVAYDMIKLSGAGSREKVLRKMRKKVEKRLNSTWK